MKLRPCANPHACRLSAPIPEDTTVALIDPRTSEIRQAQIFVAVLDASSYTFAEATRSQKLPNWLGSHTRCFAFLGGTSQILVPDHLRSGVIKAHRYEPDINPSYRDLAEHYILWDYRAV